MYPRILLTLFVLPFIAGCTTHHPAATSAPTIPLTTAQARAALDDVALHRKPLDRPLVILGGYLDPGLGGAAVTSIVRQHIRDDRVITISFIFCKSFTECRRKVIEEVDRAFPSNDANATIEVDVIGLSMGGLVGRYAAAPEPGQKRLNVRRLFTVSSPHQGALRAMAWPSLTQMQADMCPGSEFLKKLAQTDQGAKYQIYPYSREDDTVVGAQYAAPPGHKPFTVPNEPFQPAHVGAATDPRILADVLRRLRDEKPFATSQG
jgi:pimeloyl-ACP methyl ester carboxylesterase